MILTVRPLLSSLQRNPTGATLVALQVAITLAILVNAAWIVSQLIGKIEQPAGFDTRDTFFIVVAAGSGQFNAARAETEDLAFLGRLPGVAAATLTNGVPLTENGWGSQLWRQPGQRGRFAYTSELGVDARGLKALGVSLVSGRNFRPGEIQPLTSRKGNHVTSEIIVTQSLANALFPRGHALGNTVYDRHSNPMIIIGVSQNFMGPQAGGGPPYNTALTPTLPGEGGFYRVLVRTDPGDRDSVLRTAKQHIGASHRDGVIVDAGTLADAKQRRDANSRNVAIFLTTVMALMLAVCCLGVFGLTTFNVGGRTRQIGTRRALGARKRDVVAHFMMENALILTAGTLLGSMLALAIDEWLTAHYGLPHLSVEYLLVGGAGLWGIGQLAAWQPARRAANIPPSVATRTV